MSSYAVLTMVDGDGGDAGLVVVGRTGLVVHESRVAVSAVGRGSARGRPPVPPVAADSSLDDVLELLAVADGDLYGAGWTRTQGWAPTRATSPVTWPTTSSPSAVAGPGRDRAWRASVSPRPLRPVVGADQQVLEALRRLTEMARGPVTAMALVPQVLPRWQAAAAVLRRLVAAGQVRAVGATGGRISRTLYAPVRSPWAPHHDGDTDTAVDDAPGNSAGGTASGTAGGIADGWAELDGE